MDRCIVASREDDTTLGLMTRDEGPGWRLVGLRNKRRIYIEAHFAQQNLCAGTRTLSFGQLRSASSTSTNGPGS